MAFVQTKAFLQCLQSLFLLRAGLVSGDNGQPGILDGHVSPGFVQHRAWFNERYWAPGKFGEQ
jgi:hypothetical protein